MNDQFKPYLSDPMVENITDELDSLNDPRLNKMIVSVDWIIGGVRDFYSKYHNKNVKLKTGQFSASILISRGLLFLDRAHSTKNVDEIIDYVFKNTITGEEKSILKNIYGQTIPRLNQLQLIELSTDGRAIKKVMPYAVSSRYFIDKNVVGELYNRQINQYEILAAVQDFPVQRNVLAANSTRKEYFATDYSAILGIDVIRDKVYGGVPYTVAKDFIMTNRESLDVWKTVLETSSAVRKSFRDLMVLQGQLGGYITEQDAISNFGWNPRIVYKMFRNTDSHGLAKLTRTLSWEDALIRPIPGSKLAFNYTHLNGAPEVLTLTRQLPESINILDKLYRKGSIETDELLDEFPGIISKTEHILLEVGILDKDKLKDGQWCIAKNKECEDFLLEVMTIASDSRRISEAKSTQTNLADYAKYLDATTIDTDSKKLQEEYDKEFAKLLKK